MALAVEVLGVEHLGGVGDRALRKQHRAEHRLLGVEVLRRDERGVVGRRGGGRRSHVCIQQPVDGHRQKPLGEPRN